LTAHHLPCGGPRSTAAAIFGNRAQGARQHSVARFLLMAASPLGGPAAARQDPSRPAADSLPSVIYPPRDPDNGSQDRGPLEVTPAPGHTIVEVPPYVVVGGVLGYWDSQHQFHARSAATAANLGPEQSRSTPGNAARPGRRRPLGNQSGGTRPACQIRLTEPSSRARPSRASTIGAADRSAAAPVSDHFTRQPGPTGMEMRISDER